MNRFRISALTLLAAVSLVAAVVLFELARTWHRFPAPRISGTVAFNEKALWLRHVLQEKRPFDIIIGGSSMALDNLDGAELARVAGTTAVINTSAWGMCIPQSLRVVRAVMERVHPKLVILPVYFGDFQHCGITSIEWDHFHDCLFAPRILPLYENDMDPIYFEKAYWYKGSRLALTRQIFVSLAFDDYGGVPLENRGFVRDEARWEGTKDQHIDEANWDPAALADLRDFSASLRRQKIALLVVACPMRQSMETILADTLERDIWIKVPGVLDPVAGRFVHVRGGPDFDDAMFADYAHMNVLGSRKMADLLAPTVRELLRAQATWR